MSVTITITGAEEIVRRLDNATATQTLQRAVMRSVNLLANRMAKYPPARAGSSYVRTGTLGRRWTTEVKTMSDRVQGKVGNNTVYGPWVPGKLFQATIHRGRWQTDQDVMDRELPRIEGYFREELNRALESR